MERRPTTSAVTVVSSGDGGDGDDADEAEQHASAPNAVPVSPGEPGPNLGEEPALGARARVEHGPDESVPPERPPYDATWWPERLTSADRL